MGTEASKTGDKGLIETGHFDLLLLAMAAMAKQKSQDSLKTMRKFFVSSKSGRQRLLYAWLAHQVGEHAEAYDLVTYEGAPKKALWNNLRISILVDTDRIEDALEVLREDVLRGQDQRHYRKLSSE